MGICGALDPTGPMDVGSVLSLTLAKIQTTVATSGMGLTYHLVRGSMPPGIVKQGRDSPQETMSSGRHKRMSG